MLREKRFFPINELSGPQKEALVARLKEAMLPMADLVFAYLHGSFVTEERFRDIDIGAFCRGGEAGIDHINLESDLSYELSRIACYPVELRVMNKAPVGFQMAVLRKGIVILDREPAVRTGFIEDVGRRYREYVHFRNIFLEGDGRGGLDA